MKLLALDVRACAALLSSLAVCAVGACSDSTTSSNFGEPNPQKDAGSGGNGGGFGNGNGGGEGGTSALPCNPDSANAEIANNNCDDDNDGKTDNVPTCDTGLAVDGDATAFAHAMGICDDANSKGYGLVSATFTKGYGLTDAPQNEQHGILGKYGDVIKPREGGALGIISSGYAREFDGPSGTGNFNSGKDWYGYGTGNTGKPGNGAAPPMFPKKALGCAQNNTVNDTIDVKLTLKAPPNARGFTFDLDFWSGEWPNFVCSPFNDAFIAYLTSQGLTDNISMDPMGNPISVNANFLDRCQTSSGKVGCSSQAKPGTAMCGGGSMELGGTGFLNLGNYCDPGGANPDESGGAATGWLTSTASVNPGETFTIEFVIWDAGDGVLDSLTLLDNFKWTPNSVGTGTARGVK